MKLDLKPYPLLHPSPITLVGTIINDKPNYTTIGDVAVAGLNPALVMISLNANHNAMTYIDKHHKMSLNLPTRDMVRKVDFAGIHSSKNVDKSNLFDYRIEDGLPVIDDSPITLLIREVHRHQIKQRVILICEVYRTIASAKLMNNQHLCLQQVFPVLYGLDNKYYTIGEIIGEGYKSGHEGF